MPLSSQSIFHTLLIELTFMVHKISTFLKHMPSPQPETWYLLCHVPGLDQQQENKRNWSNTCIDIGPRGRHICATEGSRITPLWMEKEGGCSCIGRIICPV